MKYTLNYKITKYVTEEVNVLIDDTSFIVIQHEEDGKRMLTAFLGHGENKAKKSIKVSSHGGILEVKNLAGNSLLNAKYLLTQDVKNQLVDKIEFLRLYANEVSNLINLQ